MPSISSKILRRILYKIAFLFSCSCVFTQFPQVFFWGCSMQVSENWTKIWGKRRSHSEIVLPHQTVLVIQFWWQRNCYSHKFSCFSKENFPSFQKVGFISNEPEKLFGHVSRWIISTLTRFFFLSQSVNNTYLTTITVEPKMPSITTFLNT